MTVELSNAGPGEIWMVGVVDGSETGARYPRWAPAVTAGGAEAAAPPAEEDPMVGPLRAADFRRLGPGESFDPTERRDGAAYLPLSTFATFAPTAAGRYRFRLTLSTQSEGPEQWLGRFNQDEERERVLELIAHVPRLTIRSNELEVEVR